MTTYDTQAELRAFLDGVMTASKLPVDKRVASDASMTPTLEHREDVIATLLESGAITPARANAMLELERRDHT